MNELWQWAAKYFKLENRKYYLCHYKLALDASQINLQPIYKIYILSLFDFTLFIFSFCVSLVTKANPSVIKYWEYLSFTSINPYSPRKPIKTHSWNLILGSHLNFPLITFKGCLPQILFGPFLNSLTYLFFIRIFPRTITQIKLSVS